MSRTVFRLGVIGALVMILALLAPVVGVFRLNAQASGGEGFVVVGTGLNSPRGLTFGPDGNLYVAEGGLGGTHSTIGQCQQVPGAPTCPGQM